MSVKVLKLSGSSWYNEHIGEVFVVYKKPEMYFGGMAYRCLDDSCGITITDCEVVEDA